MACQPFSQKAAKASFTPAGVVTTPSLQTQPCLVARLVERRENVGGEFAGLLENGLDQIVGHLLIAGQSGDVVEVADLPHGEKHVADRRVGRRS